MSAKDDIITRIHAARPDVPSDAQPEAHTIPRNYLRSPSIPEGIVSRFCERVADYKARVERVPAADIPAAIAAALTALDAKRVAVAEGLPEEWRTALTAAGIDVVTEHPGGELDIDALQSLDAVVTGSAVAIAETGTIVLDGSATSGRRALTLVPDKHICIVSVDDIVDGVPAALARLSPTRPLTWISGPSATSDIELQRVEGVHGPRTLHVLVVDPSGDWGSTPAVPAATSNGDRIR